MTNYPAILKSLFRSSFLAVPLFIVGLTGCCGFFSPFFILAGAISLSIPLAAMASEWLGNLMESHGHFDERPTPPYSIPQCMRVNGLYEQAMEAYEEMTRLYPTERQPYVEMIDIAIVNLRDPERARRIYQRGMETLVSVADKQALTVMFAAIRSRLETGRLADATVEKPVLRVAASERERHS